MSLRFAWVLALSACTSGLGRPWRPFDSHTTATQVIAQIAIDPEDPIGGVLITASSRWGELAPLVASRGAGAGPADRIVARAGRFAIASVPSAVLAAAPVPAVVRITIDRPTPATRWYDAATRVERIDGTAAAPLDLAATLDDAKRRWDAYAAAEAPALAAALDEAGAATPGMPLGPEHPRATDVFFPSWSGGELTVIYARHIDRASEVRTFGHVGCGKYDNRMDQLVPSEAPCAPQMIPGMVTRRAYSADLAIVITYDARGAMIREQRFAAHPVAGPAAVATPTGDAEYGRRGY